MSGTWVDILEDPDGAPYPEPVQKMWDAICEVAVTITTEPTRETVIAALESVLAEKDATIAALRAEVEKWKKADAAANDLGRTYRDRAMKAEAESAKLRAEVERLHKRLADGDELKAALARVEALHPEIPWHPVSGKCDCCRVEWPCPTIKALRGEGA